MIKQGRGRSRDVVIITFSNEDVLVVIGLKRLMMGYSMLASIRTLETKTQFLRRPFQFSVNEVFRMKAEHFSFKMKVLAISKLAKQSQKTPFCSGE